MLKTEILQDGKLIRTYSDTPAMGLLQVDTGIKYAEAVDVYPCPHEYAETPLSIDEQEVEAQRNMEQRLSQAEAKIDSLQQAVINI